MFIVGFYGGLLKKNIIFQNRFVVVNLIVSSFDTISRYYGEKYSGLGTHVSRVYKKRTSGLVGKKKVSKLPRDRNN